LAEKSDELEHTADQLRQVNERLRALDTQKDDFLTQVSHELRTPMTSIRSFSEILMDGSQITDEERSQFVTIIHKETQRLTRLLDELLDINRLEAGTAKVELEAIDVTKALDAALASISGLTRHAGVKVEVDVSIDGAFIQANSDRLQQVLINILSNAVKYNTADQPRIKVHGERQKSRVLIDIIDNGGGITHVEATTVFDKFVRGKRAGRDQGAGLGLPISRAIMRAMGGDLKVEFAANGSSYFRLYLVPSDVPEGTATSTP
jgi:signal transduction histidine kinase